MLPTIIRDTAKDVFGYEPEPANRTITLSTIFFNNQGKLQNSYSTDLVMCLKTRQSLSDIEKRALSNLGFKEIDIREIGLEIHYLKAYEPLNKFRIELEKKNDNSQSTFTTGNLKFINIFWEKCLQKVDKLPERQFILEENDNLLDEAKNLKKEIIKRIKKKH